MNISTQDDLWGRFSENVKKEGIASEWIGVVTVRSGYKNVSIGLLYGLFYCGKTEVFIYNIIRDLL